MIKSLAKGQVEAKGFGVVAETAMPFNPAPPTTFDRAGSGNQG